METRFSIIKVKNQRNYREINAGELFIKLSRMNNQML